MDKRFLNKVNVTDECWEWTGAKNNKGYGKLSRSVDGKRRDLLAHRYSYELHHGPVPDDLVVCHRCDNRLCVRPDHLFIATQSENVKDSVKKGRWVPKEYYTEDMKKW